MLWSPTAPFVFNIFSSWSMHQCKLPVLQQTCGLLSPAVQLRLWNKLSFISRGDVRVQWTNVQKLLSVQERDLWNACKLHALSPWKLFRYVFSRLEMIMVMMFEINGEKIEDERLKQQRIRFFVLFFLSQLEHPFSQIISLLVCRKRANWNDWRKSLKIASNIFAYLGVVDQNAKWVLITKWCILPQFSPLPFNLECFLHRPLRLPIVGI